CEPVALRETLRLESGGRTRHGSLELRERQTYVAVDQRELAGYPGRSSTRDVADAVLTCVLDGIRGHGDTSPQQSPHRQGLGNPPGSDSAQGRTDLADRLPTAEQCLRRLLIEYGARVPGDPHRVGHHDRSRSVRAVLDLAGERGPVGQRDRVD